MDKWFEITKKPFTVANSDTFKFFMRHIYPKIPELASKKTFIISLRIHIDFNDNGKIVMYKVFTGKKIYYITNDKENPQIVRTVDIEPQEVFYYVKKNQKDR